MVYFKKILRYAIPYKSFGYLNIFFNVLYAIFSGLSFLVLMPLFKVIFKKESQIKGVQLPEPKYENFSSLADYLQDSFNYYIATLVEEDKSSALLFVIVLIVSIFLLKNLFNYLAMYFITFLRNGILKDLRNDLFQKTVDLPLSYFSEKRKGDVMARIGTDVLEIQHSFLAMLELLFREPLTILFTVLFMLFLSVDLTIFIFIFIPFAGYFISLIGKSLKRKSDRVQKEQGNFLSLLEETLGGLKIIKAFNAEEKFNNKFSDSTQKHESYLNKLINRTNLASPTSEFLGIAVFGVLLWYGGNLVLIEKTLDGEAFIAFLGLAYNVLTPAKAISKASYSIKK